MACHCCAANGCQDPASCECSSSPAALRAQRMGSGEIRWRDDDLTLLYVTMKNTGGHRSWAWKCRDCASGEQINNYLSAAARRAQRHVHDTHHTVALAALPGPKEGD